MGNCASCLGERRAIVDEEGSESRLLYGDSNATGYGSFEPATMAGQDSAQESQREFEALQRVVARTSDNMVDVFEIAPQPALTNVVPSPYVNGLPDNRIAQYQTLLSKLSVDEDGSSVDLISGHDNDEASISDVGTGDFPDSDEPTIVIFCDTTVPTKGSGGGDKLPGSNYA